MFEAFIVSILKISSAHKDIPLLWVCIKRAFPILEEGAVGKGVGFFFHLIYTSLTRRYDVQKSPISYPFYIHTTFLW